MDSMYTANNLELAKAESTYTQVKLAQQEIMRAQASYLEGRLVQGFNMSAGSLGRKAHIDASLSKFFVLFNGSRVERELLAKEWVHPIIWDFAMVERSAPLE